MKIRQILAGAIRRHSELAGTRILLTADQIEPVTVYKPGGRGRIFRAKTKALDGRPVFIESTCPMQLCLRGFQLKWVGRNDIRISPAA